MSITFELQQVGRRSVVAIDEQLASNAAALVLDDFIVAVDATMRPDTSRTFRSLLEEQYRRPVKYLCVTHYHADHVFGLKSFRDMTLFGSSQLVENLRQSPDWTPQAFAERVKNDPGAQEWLDEVEFVIPPLQFHQRLDLVNNGQTIEFHHSGGHTSCSVYGYYPDEKVLFAADLIFSGRFPYAGDPTCDPEKWIATLRHWLTMDIDYSLPGHGPVTDQGEIRKYLDLFEGLKSNTLKAIETGAAFQDIVLPDVYPLDEKAKWFAGRTQKHWYAYYRKSLLTPS